MPASHMPVSHNMTFYPTTISIPSSFPPLELLQSDDLASAFGLKLTSSMPSSRRKSSPIGHSVGPVVAASIVPLRCHTAIS